MSTSLHRFFVLVVVATAVGLSVAPSVQAQATADEPVDEVEQEPLRLTLRSAYGGLVDVPSEADATGVHQSLHVSYGFSSDIGLGMALGYVFTNRDDDALLRNPQVFLFTGVGTFGVAAPISEHDPDAAAVRAAAMLEGVRAPWLWQGRPLAVSYELPSRELQYLSDGFTVLYGVDGGAALWTDLDDPGGLGGAIQGGATVGLQWGTVRAALRPRMAITDDGDRHEAVFAELGLDLDDTRFAIEGGIVSGYGQADSGYVLSFLVDLRP